MKLTHIITEAFDSTYPISSHTSASEYITSYEFKTETGKQYVIEIVKLSDTIANLKLGMLRYEGFKNIPDKPATVVEIAFYLVDEKGDMVAKYSRPNTIHNTEDNTMKILSTVLGVLKEVANTINPDVIYFEGTKKLAAAYEKMLYRYLPSNYSLYTVTHLNVTHFVIVDKQWSSD